MNASVAQLHQAPSTCFTAATEAPMDEVLVLASSKHDAEELSGLLRACGVISRVFTSAHELVALFDGPNVGALVLRSESLSAASAGGLLGALECQPPWSDLPVVVLASSLLTAAEARVLDELREISCLALVDHPVSALTLTSTLDSQLRVRRRQCAARDFVNEARAARQRAEQASAEKDKLLAQVCHELQAPVSAILLWSRLAAADGFPRHDMARALSYIQSSARSQAHLVSTLLDSTQLASGTLQLNLRRVRLLPAVEAAVTALRPVADAMQVGLEVTLDAGEAPVLADVERVQRVVWNLLSRAVKLTPAGEVVALRLGADDRQHVLTIVFRSDEMSPWSGLDTSRDLVRMHGGAVHFESRSPHGTAMVTVVLPAGEQQESTGAPNDVRTFTETTKVDAR